MIIFTFAQTLRTTMVTAKLLGCHESLLIIIVIFVTTFVIMMIVIGIILLYMVNIVIH